MKARRASRSSPPTPGGPSSAFLGPGPGRGACGRTALAWVHGDLEDPSRAPEARPRAPPCAGAARRRAAFARRTRRMSAALKVSHGALELLRESVAGCVRVASAPRGPPAEPRGARPPLLRGRAAAGRRAWPSTPPTTSAPGVHVATLGGRLARAWVVGYRPTPLRHSSQFIIARWRTVTPTSVCQQTYRPRRHKVRNYGPCVMRVRGAWSPRPVHGAVVGRARAAPLMGAARATRSPSRPGPGGRADPPPSCARRSSARVTARR